MSLFGKRPVFGKRSTKPTAQSAAAGPAAAEYVFPGYPDIMRFVSYVGSRTNPSMAAETEIVELLLKKGNLAGTPHFPTILAGLGALTGFAIQQFVWQELVDTGKQKPEECFVTVKNKTGHTVYHSQTTVLALMSTDESLFSVWRLVAGAAMKAGMARSDLPTDPTSFLHEEDIKSGTPSFERFDNLGDDQPTKSFLLSIQESWAEVEGILKAHDRPPRGWPSAMGIVAQDLLLQANRFLAPEIAIQLIIEPAAIMMSIDPASVDPVLARPTDLNPAGADKNPFNRDPLIARTWHVRQDAFDKSTVDKLSVMPIEARREFISDLQSAIMTLLKTHCDSDGNLHYPTLLALSGALAGFSAQQVVWRVFVSDQGEEPETFFLTITSEGDARTYYYGETTNAIVASKDANRVSIWHLVSGAAIAQGLRTEDLLNTDTIFAHYAVLTGEQDYGALTVEQAYQPSDHIFTMLVDCWLPVQDVLMRYGEAPLRWPLVLGEVVQNLMHEANGEISPHVSLQIVMESAISMSKVDPRLVMHGTAEAQKTAFTEPL